jgi:hypothetical protein
MGKTKDLSAFEPQEVGGTLIGKDKLMVIAISGMDPFDHFI